MPGNETTIWVHSCLVEFGTEGSLSGEVHIAEEELSVQAGRRLGCTFAISVDDLLNTPIEETNGESTEVEGRGEQCCSLRFELRRAGLGLLEGRSVLLVLHYFLQLFQGKRLTSSMRC